MSEIALVGMLAGGTLLMRASMVALLANVTLPDRLQEALKLVAPALLAGLIAQTLFLQAGEFRPIGTWHLAAVVAALVAWKTRSVGWTLVLGMGAVWILEAVAP
jgi:branched-subunit amino acid transport protein